MKSKFSGAPKQLWEGIQDKYDYYLGKNGTVRRTCHADTKKEAERILKNTFGNDVKKVKKAWGAT